MTYDTAFYAEETRVAQESAEIVLPVVLMDYPAASVIDIGCGTGAWAWIAQNAGCAAVGVDFGVPTELRFPIHYIDQDLTVGYPCVGFHLAICLEVAEHLPEESADSLIVGLAQAESVLFSAATPGQPGVGHVNCQPHGYWHRLFAEHGKTPEFLGDRFDDPVADFYRRNLYLYR